MTRDRAVEYDAHVKAYRWFLQRKFWERQDAFSALAKRA